MRLIGLYQKVKWQESRPNDRGSWPLPTRSTCRCLRSRTPKAKRGNPVSPPGEGENPIFPPRLRRNGARRPGSFRLAPMAPIFSPLVEARVVPGHSAFLIRQADRKEGPWSCGTGCWKKRMPPCNEVDTGSEFARRESELTSGRCLAAKRCERIVLDRESDRRRRLRSTACAPSPPTLEPDDFLQILQSLLDLSNMPDRGLSGRVDDSRPLGCLSRVLGNSHARFLEGCGGRKAPVPTRRRHKLRTLESLPDHEHVRTR